MLGGGSHSRELEATGMVGMQGYRVVGLWGCRVAGFNPGPVYASRCCLGDVSGSSRDIWGIRSHMLPVSCEWYVLIQIAGCQLGCGVCRGEVAWGMYAVKMRGPWAGCLIHDRRVYGV